MNNEKRMEETKMEMIKKLNSKEQNLQRVQRERQYKMKLKQNDEVMKRTDKKENVQRIMKVQEYEKAKLMNKIEEKMQKAEQIKQERDQLL